MVRHTANDRIVRLGRQVSDATIFMHQAIARKVGLAGTDHKYLNVIADHGKLTAGELASLSGLTTGAVTGLIDRLEKKKLVKREFDKEDRRKVFIVPDEKKIKKMFAGAHLDLREQVESLLSTFTAKECDAIERYLTGSVEIMNSITHRLNKEL